MSFHKLVVTSSTLTSPCADETHYKLTSQPKVVDKNPNLCKQMLTLIQ